MNDTGTLNRYIVAEQCRGLLPWSRSSAWQRQEAGEGQADDVQVSKVTLAVAKQHPGCDAEPTGLGGQLVCMV